MNAAGERLDPTKAAPEVVERHVSRYLHAIRLARARRSGDGGVWWDVACGYGYGTLMMPGDVRIGVDMDPAVIAEAERRHIGQYATFEVADVSQGGWTTGLIDRRPNVIVSVETLEHLDVFGQRAFVVGAAAALLPGGIFVVACPLNVGEPSNNPWHKREPTENQLRSLLAYDFTVAHFEVESYESTSGPAMQCYAVGLK